MSRNSKLNRERREIKEEKQGKRVVEIIIWSLVVLGAAFAVYISAMQ